MSVEPVVELKVEPVVELKVETEGAGRETRPFVYEVETIFSGYAADRIVISN